MVVSLLCMALLLALGLSLLLSTTTDTLISNSYRASEEAFFAADAGIAMGRRAVASALSEQITAIAQKKTPPYRQDSQVLPDSTTSADHPFFSAVKSKAEETANAKSRSQLSNKSHYRIDILSIEGGPVTDPVRNPRNGLESYTYTYTIRSTGRSRRGARVEVVERGQLNTELTASIKISRRPFSVYGTYFDRGDPEGGLVLVSGTFTGPVHTNSHFNFSSKNDVVFRGHVTQVDDHIIYDGSAAPLPEPGTRGIGVSRGAYQVGTPVPPPKNNFYQQVATLNGNGYTSSTEEAMVDPSGRPTTNALVSNLSDAFGRQPQPSGDGISGGVYVSSNDGTSITGGGVYVSGDAEVALSTNGSSQIITVGQGSSTSTIAIDYDAQTTTLTTGGTSRTFTGVPEDSSLGISESRPAVSVFVDGSITSLSGPTAIGGHTAAAIAPQTAMTVTADRHITITGDLKYSDPIVGPDGSVLPGANRSQSVLGIFTNDGNVILQPDPSRTDGGGASLEINAAIAAFNANRANDAGGIEGAILYGSGSPDPSARLTLVGARIQSNIANIKYRNRAVYFDPRLDGGQFAPPFFPGIEIEKQSSDLTIQFAGEQAIAIFANAWHRDDRRHKRED